MSVNCECSADWRFTTPREAHQLRCPLNTVGAEQRLAEIIAIARVANQMGDGRLLASRVLLIAGATIHD